MTEKPRQRPTSRKKSSVDEIYGRGGVWEFSESQNEWEFVVSGDENGTRDGACNGGVEHRVAFSRLEEGPIPQAECDAGPNAGAARWLVRLKLE